jgi:tetratricopeptide (TPR) repeat protein
MDSSSGQLNENNVTNKTGDDFLVDIKYNMESLRKLLMHTNDVLADVSTFLKEDEAYQYSMPFYTRSGYSFPEKQWKEVLNQYAEDHNKKRKYQQLLDDLERELSTFEKNVKPIWTKYLPKKDYVCIKSNVYFTAFNTFDAINVHDNIIINTLHPKFHTNTDYLLNGLAHELFHTGYSSCSPHRSELLLEQKIYYLLETLHNEGLTTYVAMQACEQYPASDISEYNILKDEDKVKELRQNLNAFFSQIDTMTTDEVMKKAWLLGIQQRGFYVIGADMARKIEIQQGRKVLAETVTEGPIHFYEHYNSIAKEKEKLYFFNLSEYISPANKLQDAILTNVTTTINQVKNNILENKAAIPQSELEVYYRLGYRLLRGKKQIDNAEIVFKLLLDLADNPSFAYAYLGEIEIERGNKTQAKEYLSKSLKLDEYNPLALKLMASLK